MNAERSLNASVPILCHWPNEARKIMKQIDYFDTLCCGAVHVLSILPLDVFDPSIE